MVTEPLLYEVESAADRLGVGRTTTYQLIRTGELRSIKVGRRRLVPAAALEEFVDEQVEKQGAGAA